MFIGFIGSMGFMGFIGLQGFARALGCFAEGFCRIGSYSLGFWRFAEELRRFRV